MHIAIAQSNELSNQWLITAREFYEQNYAAKIAAGQVQVFDFVPPPAADAPKETWDGYHMMMRWSGNAIEITTCKKLADDYYSFEGLSCSGDHRFLVIGLEAF